MRELKGETVKERLIRVEEQRMKDVELNNAEHIHILSKMNDILIVIDNHLSHHRKAFWVLASLIGAEVLRQLLPPLVQLMTAVK